VHSALDATIPFRFLSREDRDALLVDATRTEYAAGDEIIRQGDAADDRVFIIEEGSVESIDLSRSPPKVGAIIGAGHYFGERAPLFDEPRRYAIRALEPTKVLAISGERFLRLITESRAFAQALGDILRDKQGIFAGFEHFLHELGHGVGREEIVFRELLPLYQALEPALHPHANDEDVIDFGALAYAVRRLPRNVTRTFAWYITDNLPDLYARPDLTFKPISTDARPRAIYEMLPGKDMVLIRDGLSDLVDLVTCMCLFSLEARKIRRRLRTPEPLLAIDQFIRDPAGQDRRAFLRTLPFDETEVDQLVALWPDDPVSKLQDIAIHHEDFAIHVRKQRNNYNHRHSEQWIAQIARGATDLLDHDAYALPPELAVHVISSNTHSVSNCLSAYLTAHADDVLAWAKRRGNRIVQEQWHDRMDLVYALARDYFAANREAVTYRQRGEHEQGIFRLSETAFTGIQVELIDTGRLMRAGGIDPGIPVPPPGKRALIVNIDFAFGQQAEEIVGSLITLFGRNLASVNVLGKAGALTGKRGDVLVPTMFVEQTTEALHPLPPTPPQELERLRERLRGIAMHVGPMLTVTGTLLQNRMMLNFYRHIWRCIGLEMEGSFYHRKIFESAELGVLRDDLALRYLYYVSDLPLDHTTNLSGRMAPSEGIPPLYAITREILAGIFDQERAR
jgi:CRP-like cAMP-binding protein